MDNHYSITAYSVELKKREKGINGKKLDELIDYTSIIENPEELIKIVFSNINGTNYHLSNIFLTLQKLKKERLFLKGLKNILSNLNMVPKLEQNLQCTTMKTRVNLIKMQKL